MSRAELGDAVPQTPLSKQIWSELLWWRRHATQLAILLSVIVGIAFLIGSLHRVLMHSTIRSAQQIAGLAGTFHRSDPSAHIEIVNGLPRRKNLAQFL